MGGFYQYPAGIANAPLGQLRPLFYFQQPPVSSSVALLQALAGNRGWREGVDLRREQVTAEAERPAMFSSFADLLRGNINPDFIEAFRKRPIYRDPGSSNLA